MAVNLDALGASPMECSRDADSVYNAGFVADPFIPYRPHYPRLSRHRLGRKGTRLQLEGETLGTWCAEKLRLKARR